MVSDKIILRLKFIKRRLLSTKRQVLIFFSLNWTKTLYFNFKMFPFQTAVKVPVFFYGRVKFDELRGEVIIEGSIKTGMIEFGKKYEMITKSIGNAEMLLNGTLIFKGHVQFGKDYFVYISKNAICEMGHMSSLGRNGKLVCTEKVTFGKYARAGFESQIIDTNYHRMIDLNTGQAFPLTAPIILGEYNYIGNRISIMAKTATPNYCTIASNSLCNKDYTGLGTNILLGGIPAKLVRTNISRDWEGEKHLFDELLRL